MRPLQVKNFEIRLAETDQDLDAAQALRYHVFYDERGAHPTAEQRALRRDADAFDPVCDHLLVIDRDQREATPFVVGTYRLLRRSVAQAARGFYTAREYDLGGLSGYPGETLELGRSCVHPAYRGGSVMQVLWRGLSTYVARHGVDMMFGCASFHGTDPQDHAQALSYLHHCHRAPLALRPRAMDSYHVDMDLLPRAALDVTAARRALPPLIKGYLRVGGVFGDGAVIDAQFNTLDVCVIVETARVVDRYQRRYLETVAAARTEGREVAA